MVQQQFSSWSRYTGRRKPMTPVASDVGAIPAADVGVSVAALVSGTVPTEQIPEEALTGVHVVNSEAEQLALVAREGDVCKRADIATSYWKNSGTSGTMADWTIVTEDIGDYVVSINGQSGELEITPETIGAAAADHEHEIPPGAWMVIEGATRVSPSQISMTGLGALIPYGSLIGYAWGAVQPERDSDYLYGVVGAVEADSVTLAFGEEIPEGATTLWVRRNVNDQNLWVEETPVLGGWASAVVATDAFDVYCGWHCRVKPPKVRCIGAYNLYPRIVDTGAVQPSVNFVIGATTLLTTPYTVAAEPADTLVGACTGMIAAGITAVKGTRIKVVVPATGTNKVSLDLQKALAFVILDS